MGKLLRFFYLLHMLMGESFQDYSWIQDFEADFPTFCWKSVSKKCEYLVGILQVLRLEFWKFRILEILNFFPCMLKVTQNVHVQLSSGARGLIVGLRNHLFLYYASGSSEGSGKTANAQAHYGLQCSLMQLIPKSRTCWLISTTVEI